MMTPVQEKQQDGLRVVQMVGPFLEVFFDYATLPPLKGEEERFVLEIRPQGARQAAQWLTPNGAGPHFVVLEEGESYRFILHHCPHPAHWVDSRLEPFPAVDCFFEHPQFLRLTWRGMDVAQLKAENRHYAELIVDGEKQRELWLDAEFESFVPGRPQQIELRGKNESFFVVRTNLGELRPAAEFDFTLADSAPRLDLYPCISSERDFKVRAELTRHWNMDRLLRQQAAQLGLTEPTKLVGGVRFQTPGQAAVLLRLFGYGFVVDESLISHIQTQELGLKAPQTPREYRLELQLTSAHRELFKSSLASKTLPGSSSCLSFTEQEVEAAKARLFIQSPLVAWDTSLIELVAFFKKPQEGWQEFTREKVWLAKTEFTPLGDPAFVEAQWCFWELGKEGQAKTWLKSGKAYQDQFPPQVTLKPFSDRQLLVWWDLKLSAVEKLLKERFDCGLDSVGFYLKFHEEYLGSRKPRPDLEVRILDLFTPWQNFYVSVQPNRCFSAEIVARHYDQEIALTPVCAPIITPRSEDDFPGQAAPLRHLGAAWPHPSQREVHHVQGQDSANHAKVMLHLHLHSPSLFRAEQFREAYLKPQPWPIRTSSGEEVHNTPGEWALKNCFDSWLPLLQSLRRLAFQGVDFQVSLDISPPVAYMISHPRFKDYFARYLLRVETHAKAVLAQMKARLEAPEWIWAAQKHLDRILDISHFWQVEIKKDLIAGFRILEEAGFVELSTCTATHGMPANLESTPDALDAQVALAVSSHERIFGRRPAGIWLAENSCFPGVEQVLARYGLKYYFVEAEAILLASHATPNEEFHPLLSEQAEVVAFGRSRMGRVQVWDAEIGYAGHPDFREYHHRHWGLPLKRITDKKSWNKAAYNEDWAKARAQELAQDFHRKLSGKGQAVSQGEAPHIPLITCTYDAELFGHHWHEGVWFFEELLREFHRQGDRIGLTTPSHYLAGRPRLPVGHPNPSTWGHEAQHSRWNDPQVAWVQREVQRADGILRHYLDVCKKGELNPFFQSVVAQMGKELLRAESSDLTFVIISGDFIEDMRREILKYLDYFYRLKTLVDNRIEEVEFLRFRQFENDMFPEIARYYGVF